MYKLMEGTLVDKNESDCASNSDWAVRCKGETLHHTECVWLSLTPTVNFWVRIRLYLSESDIASRWVHREFRVCSHWQRPRPIKNRLYGIVWRCSHWPEQIQLTDANGFQTYFIDLGFGLCPCENTPTFLMFTLNNVKSKKKFAFAQV